MHVCQFCFDKRNIPAAISRQKIKKQKLINDLRQVHQTEKKEAWYFTKKKKNRHHLQMPN